MGKSYSIGIHRADGDFAILATLNNLDEHISDEQFERLKNDVVIAWQIFLPDEDVKALEREDAPSYVDLGEDGDAAFEADVREIVTGARDKIMNDPRFAQHNSKVVEKVTQDIMDAIDKAGF